MHFKQVLDSLPILQVFLHPSAPPWQYLQLAQGPLDEQDVNINKLLIVLNEKLN